MPAPPTRSSIRPAIPDRKGCSDACPDAEFGEERAITIGVDSLLVRFDGLMCKRLDALSKQLDATVRAAVKEAAGARCDAAPAANCAATRATSAPCSAEDEDMKSSDIIDSGSASATGTTALTSPTARPVFSKDLSQNKTHFFTDEEEETIAAKNASWTRRLVIPHDSKFGLCVRCLSTTLIIYVATVFPYKLCFLDLNPHVTDEAKNSYGWFMVDSVVSAAFIFDLFIHFFVSYKDKHGDEVFDLCRIAKNYTCQFMFLINAVACLPEPWFLELVRLAVPGADPGGANKGALLLRMQRVVRLVRILRLVKLSSLLQFSMVRRLLKNSGPRLIGLVVALFWSMHLLGCGWFLLSVLHDDPTEVWLFRRDLEKSGPAEQWVTSMYFVLTVFTSVGFGDIHASTVNEMLYAGLVMMIGAALNTLFLGQILEMWSASDLSQIEMAEATTTIQGFAEHTHLSDEVSLHLENYARSMKGHASSTSLSNERARKLFNGPFVSRENLPEMADQVFGGALMKHSFLTQLRSGVYTAKLQIPNRLVLFLAAMCVEKRLGKREVLFEEGEMASFLYLVTKGTCAYVKAGAEDRGLCPYQLLGSGKYCGAYEILRDRGTYVANVRCESKFATTLALTRKDFLELCKENFPIILMNLARMAFLHDMSRRRRMKVWTAPISHKALACSIIWTHFSAWRQAELGTVASIRRWPVWPNTHI